MVAINYVWDELSDNVISEVDDSGNTTAEYTNEPSLYGELISQRRDSADSYFHFDSQRSTRQLTTDDETETDNYSYSAFGEPVASSGTTANPFRFVGGAGYYTDIEIGEIYVRARKYRPTVGRWLSMDPMVFIDGPNRYVYVNNDPSNFVDPRGTFINIELKTSRDSHCWGRIPFAEWDFSHEPRPCFGYFVQKVELECSGGDCFCDAQVHKKVLYEAWSVEPHKSKWSGHGGLRHHFHR